MLKLWKSSTLNDKQILKLCEEQALIFPYKSELIRLGDSGQPIISYGLSSFGYDVRLSAQEFKLFRHEPGEVTDPKHFRYSSLVDQTLRRDGNDLYFVVPGHSYALGVTLEAINMPEDLVAICVGKSTYARCGLIVNVTPLEPGWKGFITLEMSNSSDEDCRVYVNEGICQLMFFRGLKPKTTYSDRKGKYQNQGQRITPPKV